MLRRILSSIALALVLVGAARSQETRATIVGRVTDASGAIVPNADVVVLNKAMGTTVSIRTNSDGIYTAPLLLPGAYQITVASSGFKKSVRDNVILQIADRIEVNLVLELGGTEQTITVTAAPELLGTETASVGNVVTAQQIMDLPLSYGNPFSLIGISSGTGFTGSPRLDRPFEPSHIANYSMDGTRGLRSDITLDGAPATATANAREVIASYVPPTDLLAEFKIQTATFDAAVGNTEGGVTNLSIKSGTNNFHGTLYYGLMRKDFWANDFYSNKAGKPTPDFRFDRWGGSIGGPIWIPKLYNGRNRTFFEFGEEGIHDSRPRYDAATTPNVPTPEMKNGDFSALLKLGSQYKIYNPYTRRQSGNRFVEDEFPGNIIPPSLFNPVGKTILDKYYAAPSSPGVANADGTNNMLEPDLAEKAKYYTYTARIDENISDKQRIYARFSDYIRNSTYNDYFHNPSTGIAFLFESQNTVFDDTYILNPTTVLDVRYGYNRFVRGSDGNKDGIGFDLTQLGFPAAYNNMIPADIRRFPRIDLTNYIGTGFTGEYRPVDTHSISGSITKTIGPHSIRGGVDFRSYRENDGFFSNEQTGRFNFDSTYTRGPNDNSPTSPSSIGQSVAALLLGIPSVTNSYVNIAASYAEQSTNYGFYIQDDWKVTPRLTLNLGMRWEFETPLTERYNRTVEALDPAYVPPFAAGAIATYAKNAAAIDALPASQWNVAGGLTFAGIGGVPRELYNTPKNNWLPRFGFAYQLRTDTVLRGGFGVYQGFLGERRGDVVQTGYSQQTPFTPFAPDGVTLINTLSNPFPNGLVQPVGASLGGQTAIGQNITVFNQHPQMPRMYRWLFNVQHQLPGAMLVEAAYVGNKGIRIELDRNINGLPDQYLSTLPYRDNSNTCNAGAGCGNGYITASVPNPFYGLTLPRGTSSSFTSTTISRQQLLLPYPQYGAITTTTNDGYSWYHSVQLRLEKRFTKGLTVAGNYTFSKYMQATELLNSGDAKPTRMISDQDIPHRLAADWIYQLPFGKGHRILGSANGFVDRLVHGWEITGVWAFQSGFPLAFGNPNNMNTATTNNGDFFLIADPSSAIRPVDQRTADRWFNTTPFVTASAGQPANHLRVLPYRFSGLRGPRANNVDMALIKDTRLREGQTLRFSVQALNAFNHPLLPAPNVTPTNLQFGQVVGSTQNNYPRRLQLEFKYIF